MGKRNETPEEREARLAYHRAYYAANREKALEQQRVQRAVSGGVRRSLTPEQRTAARARSAAWHAANREQVLAARRTKYAADENGRRTARREHYAADPASYAVSARQRRADPAKRARDDETKRAWIAANLDKRADIEARRRARKAAATVEKVERAEVWRRDAGVCFVCDTPANPDRWHLDHVIPLAAGGAHSYANAAVAHPRCNLRKHGHDPRREGSPYAFLLPKLTARELQYA